MANQQIIAIDVANALQIFTEKNGLDPILEKIRSEIDAFDADASTAKGRKDIASLANKIARSKTYLDGVGKDLVAELKKKPKLIDAERKRMRDTLDEWKIEARQPLKEWEEEQAEIALREEINTAHQEAIGMNALFDREIEIAKKEAEIKAIEDAKKAEQERLAREAQLKQAAADRAKKEAEEKAARELAEAERKIAEQKLALEIAEKKAQEKIEREKAEAERRIKAQKIAAMNAERARIEAEKRAKERDEEIIERQRKEAKQREADIEHKRLINRDVLQCFVNEGLPESAAKHIITAIAKGKIHHVTINY